MSTYRTVAEQEPNIIGFMPSHAAYTAAEMYADDFVMISPLKGPDGKQYATKINTISNGGDVYKRQAISCANDMIAVGAINAAVTEGLRVPEDISIIGHDGSYVGEITEPGLTTVSIRPYAVGRACFNVLHDCLTDKRTTKKAVVTPEVLKRGSVKAR